ARSRPSRPPSPTTRTPGTTSCSTLARRSAICHHALVTKSHSPGTVFRTARDLLLRYREDYPTARRQFSWPRLERFNWALDWFDVIAAEHPERDALRIIAEG